ncbi:MAG: hypothetical protein JW818_13125 [Pirellulales bacterium]|nr:hypothetical protein [Pirellulales bacterium]
MTTLLENPIPILVAGVVVEIILAIPFFTTRRAKWLFWMGGVLVLTLLLLLVEHLVVTPREEVETTLNDLATAIEWKTDDLDAKKQKILGFLAPSAKKLRRNAEYNLGQYTITGAWMRDLEVSVNDLTSPPTAKVEFIGMITGSTKSGEFPFNSVPVRFKAELHKINGRWLVAKCSPPSYRGQELPGDWD